MIPSTLLCAASVISTAITYTISPLATDDRTKLLVKVQFRPEGELPIKISLPQDFYTTPEIHRFVTDLVGLGGTQVSPGTGADERLVLPGADGSVILRYTMNYDPKEMEESSFGPITTPKHIQTFGCQWMLQIGNRNLQRRHNFRWVKVPENWRLYTSVDSQAHNVSATHSYMELVSSVWGAGELSFNGFEVRGKPVSVYMEDGYKMDRGAVLDSIEKIVKAQRSWFDDYEQPHFIVSISHRPFTVAGTAVENGFVCFVDRKTREREMLVLLAHEMFHYWVPGKIHVLDEGAKDRWAWEWFDEGFADYFARKVLYETGSITQEDWVELLNKDLWNIADNPLANVTYEEVKRAIQDRTFTQEHKKLSYYRGSVLAAMWDAQIREAGKGALDEVVRRLYDVARKSGGNVTQEQFHAAFASVGIDSEAALQKHIIRGETIEARGNVAGPGYELVQLERPSFDPGFDLNKSSQTRKISGLRPGSAAAKSGLKEGDEVARFENSYRFANAWSREKPFVVVLKDGRRFEFMPYGKPISVLLYTPISRAGRVWGSDNPVPGRKKS